MEDQYHHMKYYSPTFWFLIRPDRTMDKDFPVIHPKYPKLCHILKEIAISYFRLEHDLKYILILYVISISSFINSCKYVFKNWRTIYLHLHYFCVHIYNDFFKMSLCFSCFLFRGKF